MRHELLHVSSRSKLFAYRTIIVVNGGLRVNSPVYILGQSYNANEFLVIFSMIFKQKA